MFGYHFPAQNQTPKWTSIILLVFYMNVELKCLGYAEQPPLFADYGILHTMQALSHWSQLEIKLEFVLQHRVKNLASEIYLLQRYLRSTLTSRKRRRGKILIENDFPLAHKMTHIFVTPIIDIRKYLASSHYNKIRAQYEGILQTTNKFTKNSESRWPNQEDGYMSHVAITSIMELNQVPANIIRDGPKIDTKYGGYLSLSQYEKLAAFSLARDFNYISLEWIQSIFDQKKQTFEKDPGFKTRVDLMHKVAVQSHNRKYDVVYKINRDLSMSMNLFTEPYRKAAAQRYTFRESLVYYNGTKYGNGSIPHLNEVSLCSGNAFQPIEIRSRMKCYLERKMHPYLYINPVKAELLSEHPLIIQFYEVIGNSLLQELYDTRETVRLSTVTAPDNLVLNVHYRTSGGTALPDEFQEKIFKKSQMLTGLYSEINYDKIQNAEYVYGRLFRNHIDPLEDPTRVGFDLYGERLATVLYYPDASDNIHGGLTPFCEAGIFAQPVRGSAVFWLNMFKNGSVRRDISHSACPVIHGHKLILNHWIPYNPNFQTFQCTLNQFN